MADEKTKVDMSFEINLTQGEIGLMYAFIGAVRWVKNKFETPEPEPDKLLSAKKKKAKRTSKVDME